MIFLVVIALIFGTVATLPDDVDDWAESPDAYFLTPAEKRDWRRVDGVAEARAFIDDYFRRRGPEFIKELHRRIRLADELFTNPDRRGSETLSGKILIILGDPERLYLPHPLTRELFAPTEGLIFSNVRPFGTGVPRLRTDPDRIFVYRNSDGDPLVFEICQDPKTSHEVAGTKRQQEVLEALFLEAAARSIAE